MPDVLRGVGASLLRREDERHLLGRGQFVADIRLPGTVEVAFLRSPHAHARIRSIAVPLELKGRVFTAADLPRITPVRVVSHSVGAKSPPWPPLATDKVRYVGEVIAACLAPSRGEAEDLAHRVIELQGQRCQDDFFRIEPRLRSEPTADIEGDDADAAFLETEKLGKRDAQGVRRLGRGMEHDLVEPVVAMGEDAAAFERCARLPPHAEFAGDDELRGPRCGLDVAAR